MEATTKETGTMNLREALATMNLTYEQVQGNQPDWFADTIVTGIRPVISEDGSIFVHCGGEAIFAFDQPGHRRPAYLVRDDNAGTTWDVIMNRHGRNYSAAKEELAARGLRHYRPSPVIRVAQSG